METIYLKSGQQAVLIEKTKTGKYLVDPIKIYNSFGEEDDFFEEQSGQIIAVDEIFEKPPLDKISKEYKDIQNKIKDAEKTLRDVLREKADAVAEKRKIELELTSMKHWRIDRKQFRECKRFAFFVKNSIMPVVIGGKKNLFNARDFRILFSVDMLDGKVSEWVSSVDYKYDSWSYAHQHKIDEDYDFMFDPTDEELIEITKKRSDTLDLSKLSYTTKANTVPEKFRTDRVNAFIIEEEKRQHEKNISNKKEQILKLQKELEDLQKV